MKTVFLLLALVFFAGVSEARDHCRGYGCGEYTQYEGRGYRDRGGYGGYEGRGRGYDGRGQQSYTITEQVSLSPAIIDMIQRKFNGRVVSFSANGDVFNVQVMSNGRVIIVTVDQNGQILGVQQ